MKVRVEKHYKINSEELLKRLGIPEGRITEIEFTENEATIKIDTGMKEVAGLTAEDYYEKL